VLQCALGRMTTQPVTITVNGTIDPAFRGQLTNTATATSTTQDPDVAASATATSTVTGAIDLAITKTADHDRGVVGQTVTFTIVASNAGPSTATDVAVDDGLPAGLVLAAARTSAGTFDATTRRWKIGTLATGASATLQLDTTLDSVGTQTNLATIGQITSDPDPPPTPIGPEESRVDNNQATASVEVFAAADQLPRTGSDAWIILRIAALLLAAGAGLTMGVHRVRRRRPA
jgi:uncharacterized repeat protein (TIGR01451 family)